jgi:hypothetical protein
MAARKKQATAEVIQLTQPDERAYFSIRLKEQGHKLRYSHGVKLVEAERDQTISFRAEPYPHFVVMPGGVQFPIENVSSAIPMAAQVATKLSRTGRGNARKAEAIRVLQEKARARAAAATPAMANEDESEPLDEDADE